MLMLAFMLKSWERASIFGAGEMMVYEAFFKSCFRDWILALIASISDFFNISSAELEPPT